MTTSPHSQAYAYRRNPAQSVHPSTFHPEQFGHGHGHGHGGAAVATRPPQAHYSTNVAAFQPAQSPAVIEPAKDKDKEKDKNEKPTSGGFSLASLAKYANPDELKGLVDRFGGLDGILSTVTTVQKVMSTVGQIAPMVKVVTGVLGNKNKNGTATEAAATIPARRSVRTTRPRTTRNNRPSSSPVRRSSNSGSNGNANNNSNRSNPNRRTPPSSRRQGSR